MTYTPNNPLYQDKLNSKLYVYKIATQWDCKIIGVLASSESRAIELLESMGYYTTPSDRIAYIDSMLNVGVIFISTIEMKDK